MRKILFCICFCIASLASCFAQTVIYSSNDDSLGYDVKTCNLESCFQHVTLNDEIRYVKIDNGINGGKI